MEKGNGSGAVEAVGKRPAVDTVATPPIKKTNTSATPSSNTQQLQQQIQQQLQQQLQAQLQAAAARGQQANITPEQIQAQAQAMVQAAAQAQAVVAAAKSRGDGLVPMNAAQIQALSQIQAQAIVKARKPPGTPQQVQTQIQLQAQALVHAHTQAQIQAGIYKGETKTAEKTASNSTPPLAAAAAVNESKPPPLPVQQQQQSQQQQQQPATITLTQAQVMEQQELQQRQANERQVRVQAGANPIELQMLDQEHARQLEDLHDTFRRAAGIYVAPAPGSTVAAAASAVGSSGNDNMMVDEIHNEMVHVSANSPQFLEQLNGSLNQFWRDSLEQIQNLPSNSSEQDFKNHNDLPLARIKRIMKSDEDVRMISAEAPVLFAKACELFILDLSIRSWNYSQLHKRRTLQKEDVKEAIQKTDIFDFLVDVIQ